MNILFFSCSLLLQDHCKSIMNEVNFKYMEILRNIPSPSPPPKKEDRVFHKTIYMHLHQILTTFRNNDCLQNDSTNSWVKKNLKDCMWLMEETSFCSTSLCTNSMPDKFNTRSGFTLKDYKRPLQIWVSFIKSKPI